MDTGKISLYVLLVITGIAAVGGAGLALLSEVTDSGNQWIWLLLLMFFAMVVPLAHVLHRPALRAGAVFLCAMFLAVSAMFVLAAYQILDSSKVMSSFMVLLYTGVPAAVALLLRKRVWAAFFTWTLFPMALLSLVVSLAAVWFSEDSSYAQHPFYAAMALLVFGAPGAVLLINVGRGDRRYFRWPGIAASAAAVTVAVAGIFTDQPWGDFWPCVSRLCGVMAFTLAFITLLLMTRREGLVRVIQWIAIAAAAATGLAALAITVLQYDSGHGNGRMLFSLFAAPGNLEEWIKYCFRGLNAAMILALATTAGLIMAREILRLELMPTEPKGIERVQMTCPNCNTVQGMAVGGGACWNCLLRFKITMTEPRCAGCNHLLLNLTQSDRCPECGRGFARQAARPSDGV